MKPHVIALGNDKGGVGKSTLAVNIAAILAHEGRRVTLIDAEPNASATRWAEAAELENLPGFHLVASEPEELRFLDTLDCDVVVIDLPRQHKRYIEELMQPGVVDLFLIPSRPSLMDLEISTERLIGEVHCPLAVVLTFTQERNSGEVEKYRPWLESDGITVTRTTIRDLKAWQNARMYSRLIMDQPGAKAAQADITALVAEIKKMLT